jgi:hypothetical protein
MRALLDSSTLPAPLPPPMQAVQAAVFANSAAVLGGTDLVCGDISILQNGYNRPVDLGDGFSRLLSSATATIAAVIAVRRAPRRRRVGALRDRALRTLPAERAPCYASACCEGGSLCGAVLTRRAPRALGAGAARHRRRGA